MSQELVRYLLSAGASTDAGSQVNYLLFVDPSKSFLNCQHWKGDILAKQELLVDAVRPGSTAAYLITPTEKLVICITPSSNLTSYTYDQDDREWVESDETPITSYTVHSNGKLVGTLNATGRVGVVFQDPSQRLIHLDDTWTSTTLPGSAVAGTPISTLGNKEGLQIYYISATDNFIHVAVQESDSTWKDAVAGNYAFTKEIKAFSIGKDEYFVLTAQNDLLKITSEAEEKNLGTVKSGKFVPATVEEAGCAIYWHWGCGSPEFPGYTGMGGTGHDAARWRSY